MYWCWENVEAGEDDECAEKSSQDDEVSNLDNRQCFGTLQTEVIETDDENGLYEEENLQQEVVGDHVGEEGERREVGRDSQQHQQDHQDHDGQSGQGDWGGDEAGQETEEGEEITREDELQPEHLASPPQVQAGGQT